MATKAVRNQSHKSLRALLEELLLTETQDQVAARLGVSQQWVHQHIRPGGPKSIQKGRMDVIAKGLGMTKLELARLCRRGAAGNTNTVK